MKQALLIILLFAFPAVAIAQIEAVTKEGKTVLLHNDNTWEYKPVSVSPLSLTVSTEVSIDEFDGTKRITTDIWRSFARTEQRSTMSGLMSDVDGLTMIEIIITSDLGCLSEQRSTLEIKLENGEVIEALQVSNTDCGSSPSARFILASKEEVESSSIKDAVQDNIERLLASDISIIRVRGSEYYADFMPHKGKKVSNPEQFFRQHLLAIRQKQ